MKIQERGRGKPTGAEEVRRNLKKKEERRVLKGWWCMKTTDAKKERWNREVLKIEGHKRKLKFVQQEEKK